MLAEYEEAAIQGMHYPERVRISTRTLLQLKAGTYVIRQGQLPRDERDVPGRALDRPASSDTPSLPEAEHQIFDGHHFVDQLHAAATIDHTQDEDDSLEGGVHVPLIREGVLQYQDVETSSRTREVQDSEVTTVINNEYYNDSSDEDICISNSHEKTDARGTKKRVVFADAQEIAYTTQHRSTMTAPEFISLDMEGGDLTLEGGCNAAGTLSASRKLMGMLGLDMEITQPRTLPADSFDNGPLRVETLATHSSPPAAIAPLVEIELECDFAIWDESLADAKLESIEYDAPNTKVDFAEEDSPKTKPETDG
ncbi:MAG: hypothetical protein Q9218_006283 [Villophora microphyllina]